jgi:hypothetical protein
LTGQWGQVMEEYQTAWGWELASYKQYIANLVIKHTIYPLVNWAILKLQLTLKLLPKQCVWGVKNIVLHRLLRLLLRFMYV